MYRNYKIVCNTAAGRRRYMQYLMPFVIASDLVDRYDVWVNTVDNADIEFFKQLADIYPKINLVWQPEGIVDGINTINSFYRQCVDDDTIYIKLDDDVVWMEDDFFQKMLDYRIDKPQFFLVSPLVINNAICTYIMQICGKLNLTKYMNAVSNHRILWKKGVLAVKLHQWFINNYLIKGKYQDLYCGEKVIAMNRFSINSILWFGKEMKKFDGIVEGDDEEFLSCIKPSQLGLANGINGNVLISHFAFAQQREHLDKHNILEQYGCFLHEEWAQSESMKLIDKTVQEVMSNVNDKVEMLHAQPIRYKTVKKSKSKKLKYWFKKNQKKLRNIADSLSNNEYIKE